MKIQVVLVDTDKKYITPLGMKFLEEYKEEVNLHVITDTDYFKNYFEDYKEIDILIVSDEICGVDYNKHNISNIYYLKDEQSECTDDMCIYKYSSVGSIFRKVVKTGENLSAPVSRTNKETKVVAVYSPCGGTGKTTLAIGMSAYLASSYRKVLYINAERINNFEHLITDCKKLQIMDFAIASAASNLYVALQEYLGTSGFDYIPPLSKALSAFGKDVDIYPDIIKNIKSANEYDIIIVDTDSCFDVNKSELLSLADEVLIVVNDTKVSQYATKNLIRNMAFNNDEKYKLICNKCSSNSLELLDGFNIKATIENNSDIEKMMSDELGQINSIKKASYLII